MQHRIALLTFLVRDYDEAIRYFTRVLPFAKTEDSALGAGKRWVVVSPVNQSNSALLLAKADGAEQEEHIGNQTGGRVFLFLHTDDFWRDFQAFKARGVTFIETPREEPYGTVAVFRDLYGNLWDLLEPK